MSSAQNSHLTPLGYDMVVATTQSALNATMLQYLSERDTVETTIKCFVWKASDDGDSSDIVEISFDELLQITPGVDPFQIDPKAHPAKDVGLQRLRFAGFACAYKITSGLPPGISPQDMPNIVELGNESASITYNMLCSEMQVCVMTYAGMNVNWLSQSQPFGQSWGFQCKVDLRMSKDDTKSALAQLPPEAQQEVRSSFGTEDAFSVQQLLFDLDNAGLERAPTVQIFGGTSKIDPVTLGVINGNFLASYFDDMHKRGQPLLHVAVVSHEPDESEFRATDMNTEVCQLIDETTGKTLDNLTKDQENLTTLNYLCATNNHILPQAQRFGWNWISESESHQFDGVIAYQRNSFISWIKPQLEAQAWKNCYIACAKVPLSSGSIPEYHCGFKNLGTGEIVNPDNRSDITSSLNSATTVMSLNHLAPQFTLTEPGNSTVMEWNWVAPKSTDTAGSPLKLGEMQLQPSYRCQVTFSGNQIIITQHLGIYLYIMKEQISRDGNIVDWTLTDTYDLKVDGHGKLTTVVTKGARQDHSETPHADAFTSFFNGLNGIIDEIRNSAQFANTNFTDPPIALVQKFQFPGGKTFAFRDFSFSRYQDLTAKITYVDPVPMNALDGVTVVANGH